MQIIDDISIEVESLANKISLETLVDRLESRRIREAKDDSIMIELLLLKYVKSKKVYLRLKKRLDDEYNTHDFSNIRCAEDYRILNQLKVEQERDRYNYYAARQRKDQHRSDCNCRGCKCIANFGE